METFNQTAAIPGSQPPWVRPWARRRSPRSIERIEGPTCQDPAALCSCRRGFEAKIASAVLWRTVWSLLQNSCCSQPHFAKTLFSMLRKLAWVLAFILATFCWVVVIEHGPDNFVVGSKIEAENFKSLFFRLIQTPGK